MSDFHDRFVIDGKTLDADIAGRILTATQTRTMDGAASIVLTLDDHDRAVLRSGIFTRQGKKQPKLGAFDQDASDRIGDARAELDGWFLRLAGVSGAGTTLTVTFEDEVATLMRRRTEATKSTRHTQGAGEGGVTRAQFIRNYLLWPSTKKQVGYVRFFSPEATELQSAKEPEKDPARQKGLGLKKTADLTIKADPIDAAQRRNLTTALKVADAELANDLATLAMLCAGIGESGWRAIPNAGGSDYGGVLQGKYKGSDPQFKLTDTEAMARSFLKGGKGFQGGGAMHLAQANPDTTPGRIALTVEGSVSNFASAKAGEQFYGQHQEEAQKILDAWGGVSQTITTRRRYTFKAGGKRDHQQHNYWDDAGDLAREVNWRLFADENTLFYVSDNWLFSRQPVIDVDPDDSAVLDITFDADVGIPIAEVTVTARSPRWTGSPGAGARVTGMGPVNGRWLLFQHDHDLYSGDDTYILHRPAPKYKEPAPDTKSRTVEADDPVTGSARARIVAAAKKALKLDQPGDKYIYDEVRPYPKGGLFKSGKVITDCSGFATLCYKAAQVADPNGLGYNGYGYTGTLLAHGEKTQDPKPGDLAFYGIGTSMEHVGVVIEGGQVIEFGGNPGPLKIKATYRPVDQYRTYDLSDV